MRWWLAAAFAGVAALTAAAVVEVSNNRSEAAFRSHAADLAVGSTVAAAEDLKDAPNSQRLRSRVARLVASQQVALFALDRDGRLLTSPVSNAALWTSVPHHQAAVQTVLHGDRYIGGSRDGSALTVGLRIHGGVAAILVTYTLRPELAAQLGIVRGEGVRSALVAFAVAAGMGLLIAVLISRRLARIASGARAIGAGDFSEQRVDRFPDEVGSLSKSIDGMRRQLVDLFGVLGDERDRLERLLSRLTDAVILVGRDLRVEFVNDRGGEWVTPGLRLDEPDAGPDVPRLLARIASDLFASRTPIQLKTTLSDGRLIAVSGIPPVAESDAAILVIADETQGERDERAQREFATNAAHELRTPLAAIVMAVEMLQTGAKEDRVARDDFLGLIERESARLTSLTRALLLLARSERGAGAAGSSVVRLLDLFDRLPERMPLHAGVETRVDCSADLFVAANPDLLEQVLVNLAANAARHTTSGMIEFRGREDDGWALIEISDTGDGIQYRDQPHVFDRFYRAGGSEGGFGLGLAIARETIRVLGGEIRLESEPGVGTTVRIRLPISAMKEAA